MMFSIHGDGGDKGACMMRGAKNIIGCETPDTGGENPNHLKGFYVYMWIYADVTLIGKRGETLAKV